MAVYRDKYFKQAKAVWGKYQCCRCKKWFKKEDIDIDHRIPKKLGGTDDISNLQAMCRHCNRSKGASVTGMDIAGTVIRSAVNGTLGSTITSAAKQNLKNALGFKYKR